jgi:hypothetical protein
MLERQDDVNTRKFSYLCYQIAALEGGATASFCNVETYVDDRLAILQPYVILALRLSGPDIQEEMAGKPGR